MAAAETPAASTLRFKEVPGTRYTAAFRGGGPAGEAGSADGDW